MDVRAVSGPPDPIAWMSVALKTPHVPPKALHVPLKALHAPLQTMSGPTPPEPQNGAPMAKVYVSSPVVDLEIERRAVMDWLVAADHQFRHDRQSATIEP